MWQRLNQIVKDRLSFPWHLETRRTLLMLSGLLVCVYSVWALCYVQTIPDLGLKSAFDTTIKGKPRVVVKSGSDLPVQGDKVSRVGDWDIDSWPKLLKAPFHFHQLLTTETEQHPSAIKKINAEDLEEFLQTYQPDDKKPFSWALRVQSGNHEYFLVLAQFQHGQGGENSPLLAWCILDHLPASELFPAILWFVLKLLLFVVGVLVLWKRPDDPASVQFFILCIITLGAYMGGYHWPYISPQPILVIGFIVCAVLLPAVTLHFYLVFPRTKGWLLRCPRRAWLAIYGLPVIFSALIVWEYWSFRNLYLERASADLIADTGRRLVHVIYCYLSLAAIWYLVSVVALVHSFFRAANLTERNQVKWIMYGALAAMIPIGYSLYLAVFDPDQFGAGGATWPMFAASLCITVAFVVSITRYRLMELDQIVSSGAVYFFISFLVGLGYYGVVVLGTLLFNRVLAGPPLSESLTAGTIALVLLVLLDLARTRLRRALDRRFHREKYHLDRTLQRMSEAVHQLVDPPTLVQRLLYASADLLGVMRGAVYLRQAETGSYRLAGWVGSAPAAAELAPGAFTEVLAQRGVVIFPGRATQPRTEAQDQLRHLGGEVARGLVHEGRVLAFLVLGAKSNGVYRPEDLNLLAAFAQITVLGLVSAEGHKTIEGLNTDLQGKVEKIAEQQRRILALQRQLGRRFQLRGPRIEDRETRSEEATANGSTAELTAPGDSQSANVDGQSSMLNGRMVGASPKLRQLLQMVRKVSRTDAVVLIRGESGTGKELLAEAVHQTSVRAEKAFVKVHCAALSPTLLESELFGHVKGAFTGAHKDKVGRFELANGGTLFLDEIGDISLEVQTKLLRVLQEKTFERVGSSEPVKSDVRVIAATHQNLEELIRRGKFREDLYYRLNVFDIIVPPLRQRREDIAELALHFLEQAAKRCGKPTLTLDDDALALLKAFAWPGNIRQLENVLERAAVLVEGSTITLRDLPEELRRESELEEQAAAAWTDGEFAEDFNSVDVIFDRSERERLERDQLERALAAAAGNKALAARNLGVARSTLVSKLKKLGIS